MAPNAVDKEVILNEDESQLPKLKAPQAEPWDYKISYFNVVAFGYWHAAGLYGGYLALTSASWLTVAFGFVGLLFSVTGVIAGAHRLWSHRAYKARLPLQIILMVFHTLSGQYTVHNWVRDHRLHHRYSDTDADPHNSTRGFFFSQIGWLFVTKHDEVKRRGHLIDVSDITSNPVLAFQKKYAAVWFALVCYVMPTLIPMYFWGETLRNAWHVNLFRFILCLHFIGLVNSAAHMFGNKPYDKNIVPAGNSLITLITLGEGYHNYHHTFPWDYRGAEFGTEVLNFTTIFINFFAWVGWAYDLKTVDPQTIIQRAERTGDGSRQELNSRRIR